MISRYYSTSNGYDNGIQKVLFQGGAQPTFGDKVYFRHKASGKVISYTYNINDYLTFSSTYPFDMQIVVEQGATQPFNFAESSDAETWDIQSGYPIVDSTWSSELYSAEYNSGDNMYYIYLAGIGNQYIDHTYIRFSGGLPAPEIAISGNLSFIGDFRDSLLLERAEGLFSESFIHSVSSLIIPARISCHLLFYNCTTLIDCPFIDYTGVTSLGPSHFDGMFARCSSIQSVTLDFPDIQLDFGSYQSMFSGCTSLQTLPQLKATLLADYCYNQMFLNCTGLKLSTTQDATYANEYRIPIIGTGVSGVNSMVDMFTGTGGSFTGTPDINTIYYTSNTIYNPPIR